MPEDFGIIGFANESFGEHITPSLSTIDQQTMQMGKEAFGLLIDLIDSKEGKANMIIKEKIVLEPLMYVRESSNGKGTPLKRISPVLNLTQLS